MSDIITKTIEGITGYPFQPTRRQQKQLDKPRSHPELIAGVLEEQAVDWRKQLARPFGIAWELVPAGMVRKLLSVDDLKKRADANPSDPWHAVKQIDVEDAVELGRISERAAMPAAMALLWQIDMVYQDVLGRQIDRDGGMFWGWMIASNEVGLDELESHFRESEEFKRANH